MRILITGTTGLLGSELVEHFSKSDEVFPIKGSKDIDITDFTAVTNFVEKLKPNLVIHSAGVRDLDACEQQPERTYLINTLGTRNLLNATRKADAIFVYISSNSVFDGKKEGEYTEFDEANPISIYGKSKLKAEREVISCNIPYFILRVPYLFGSGGYIDRNYVHKIVAALKKQEPLVLASDQKDNPTYVKDLAHMIERVAKSEAYGTYHLGNKGTATRYEFAVAIANILGLHYEDILIPRKMADMKRVAPRPANTTLSTLVYETIFKESIRSWQESLKDCINEFEELH